MRLALELAFEVARLGTSTKPPIDPPRSLQPLLHFARLPDQALAAVRRALEDPQFQARVAAVAQVPAAAGELDHPSTLFLTRPEGWEDELIGLAERDRTAAHEERETREDRTATRRAERAEADARRAGETAERARREVTRLEPALAEERRLRRAAEQEVAGSVRMLAAAEGRATSLGAEVAALQQRISRMADEREALVRQVAEARTAVPAFPDPAPAAAALASARSAAEAMADTLARALDEASAALLFPSGSEVAAPGRRPSAAQSTPAPPLSPPLRRPLAIPPAVFDDSRQAAAYLVRVPGALLLVDGYNAAMAIWPGLDVTEVRFRLIDALVELATRTGVGVHVVFDGAEVFAAPAPSRGAGPVKVSFSDPDTEAD
ncbi:MAG: hypothetical protein ABIW46_06820, partial [Acidimicrobiales bacterium]